MEEETRLAARRSLIRSAGAVVGLFLLYAFLPLRGEWWWVGALIGTLALLSLVPLTFHRVRRLVSSDRPVIEAIQTFVLLIAMLITGFAAVYYAMDRNGNQFAHLGNRVDSVYFTVVTLGTVGFGDITPTGQAARILVTLQILFDLAFIGLVVRVLTAAAQRRTTERPPAG